MENFRQELSKNSRNSFLSIINCCFRVYKVDLTELGNNKLWGESEYRNLRPYGENCSCWGGAPEEEMRYHEIHIERCLTYVDEMQVFCKQITDLIKKKGKALREKKLQVIEKIKTKDITKTCFDYLKHEKPIFDCTNSKQLAEKVPKIIKEIENLFNQTQADEAKRKKQEEENERIRKEEEEKQQKYQKNWEEKMKQDEEKWEKERKEQAEWINKTNKEIEEDKKCQQTEKPNSQRQKEEKEFLRLISLIHDCQDLANLEKNYQIVKNSPLYTNSKETFVGHGGDNKTRLDNFYANQKKYLQPNCQATNIPTQQRTVINIKSITQTENISEAITVIKNQIFQFLKKNNLKNFDLPKQYQNWEEKLNKLGSKEAIISFSQEISRQIEQKLKELKQVQNNNKNKKRNKQPLSYSTKLLIGGGVMALTISVFLILVAKRKKIKRVR